MKVVLYDSKLFTQHYDSIAAFNQVWAAHEQGLALDERLTTTQMHDQLDALAQAVQDLVAQFTKLHAPVVYASQLEGFAKLFARNLSALEGKISSSTAKGSGIAQVTNDPNGSNDSHNSHNSHNPHKPNELNNAINADQITAKDNLNESLFTTFIATMQQLLAQAHGKVWVNQISRTSVTELFVSKSSAIASDATQHDSKCELKQEQVINVETTLADDLTTATTGTDLSGLTLDYLWQQVLFLEQTPDWNDSDNPNTDANDLSPIVATATFGKYQELLTPQRRVILQHLLQPMDWVVRKNEWILFLDVNSILSPQFWKRLELLPKAKLDVDLLVLDNNQSNAKVKQLLNRFEIKQVASRDTVEVEDNAGVANAMEQQDMLLQQGIACPLVSKLSTADVASCFDQEVAEQNAYKMAYHRYNEKFGCYFYVKYDDDFISWQGVLLRANLLPVLANKLTGSTSCTSIFKITRGAFSGDLPVIAYVRAPWLVAPMATTALQGQDILSSYRGISGYLSKTALSFKTYLKQLKLTASLDSDA